MNIEKSIKVKTSIKVQKKNTKEKKRKIQNSANIKIIHEIRSNIEVIQYITKQFGKYRINSRDTESRIIYYYYFLSFLKIC